MKSYKMQRTATVWQRAAEERAAGCGPRPASAATPEKQGQRESFEYGFLLSF